MGSGKQTDESQNPTPMVVGMLLLSGGAEMEPRGGGRRKGLTSIMGGWLYGVDGRGWRTAD
jgi:hypothetical protein